MLYAKKNLSSIFSQIDCRKAKKENIHRIYYKMNTGNLTSLGKFKAAKLDESSPNFPSEILSGSQAKGSKVPRAI